MNDNLDAIVFKATNEIKNARNKAMLEQITNDYIGTNGLLTRSYKSADQIPATVRNVRIRAIQLAENKVKSAIDKKLKEFRT